MKTLTKATILALLISNQAFAESCTEKTSEMTATDQLNIDTKVPNHLKGAVIIVRQKDGRESVVPAEKFKVVPRVQQYIVTKAVMSRVINCKQDPKKNRASLVGGYGSKPGLSTNQDESPTLVEVESNVGVVGGLQYQRLLNKTLSVGGQVQSNKTASVLLGVDF